MKIFIGVTKAKWILKNFTKKKDLKIVKNYGTDTVHEYELPYLAGTDLYDVLLDDNGVLGKLGINGSYVTRSVELTEEANELLKLY